jgi:hypothetical protein
MERELAIPCAYPRSIGEPIASLKSSVLAGKLKADKSLENVAQIDNSA